MTPELARDVQFVYMYMSACHASGRTALHKLTVVGEQLTVVEGYVSVQGSVC